MTERVGIRSRVIAYAEAFGISIEKPDGNLEIAITRRDIQHGVRGQYGRCPAALAIQKKLPGAKDVLVSATRAYVPFDDRIIGPFVNPRSLKTFVVDWDDGQVVEPIDIKLTPEKSRPGKKTKRTPSKAPAKKAKTDTTGLKVTVSRVRQTRLITTRGPVFSA